MDPQERVLELCGETRPSALGLITLPAPSLPRKTPWKPHRKATCQ